MGVDCDLQQYYVFVLFKLGPLSFHHHQISYWLGFPSQ